MELLVILVVGGGVIVGGIALIAKLPDKPQHKIPEHRKDSGTSLLGLLLGLGMIGHSAAKGWHDGGTNRR